MLDVFKADAFSTLSLTTAINKLPTARGKIRSMNLFQEKGIPTTTAMIEEKEGIISLIPTADRGAPATEGKRARRKVRTLDIPHLPEESSVKATDVQNIRSFGSDSKMEAVSELVNDKLTGMKQDHEATLEHLMAGALQGSLLDADGVTEILNLFTAFNVSEQDEDFEFSADATDVRALLLSAKRKIEDALGQATYNGILCLCWQDWFDALISHPDVKAAYDRWNQGEFLRMDPRAGFTFAGITFQEYRGQIADVPFIPDAQSRFIPLGVPGLYELYYAPADFIETANTKGRPYYAKQERMDFDRGIRLHSQSNPLPICTRPRCLVKGTQS